MDKMTIIWLVVAVLAAVVEASTVQLVSVWFALGAIAGCITSLLTDSLPIHLIVFAAVTALALVVTRPLVRRIKVKKAEATNSDKYIGQEGVVIEAIDNSAAKGMVRVGSSKWMARSADDSPIEEGAAVTVTAIEGVKVIVKIKDPSSEI